jgi:hypothetical protein
MRSITIILNCLLKKEGIINYIYSITLKKTRFYKH